MKTTVLLALVLISSSLSMAQAPTPDVKFIADTLVVQADGRYEADPDLATLSFSVFAQDRNLKQTYAQTSQSMEKIAQIAEKNGLKRRTSLLVFSPCGLTTRGTERSARNPTRFRVKSQ